MGQTTFEKVRDNARKVGRWCVDHVGTAWYYGQAFVLGYGIGALIMDASGLTGKLTQLRADAARRDGYKDGFNDGMRTATDIARVVASGDAKTPIELK